MPVRKYSSLGEDPRPTRALLPSHLPPDPSSTHYTQTWTRRCRAAPFDVQERRHHDVLVVLARRLHVQHSQAGEFDGLLVDVDLERLVLVQEAHALLLDHIARRVTAVSYGVQYSRALRTRFKCTLQSKN